MPNDLRNVNEALAEIDKISIQTSQGGVVKTEDVKRLLNERREMLTAEIEDRIDKRIPYRMSADRARRLAMRDEKLKEDFPPIAPREPGRSVPAGPIASEGVKP